MANNDDVILFDSLKSMAADIEALRQNVPGDVILECEGQEIMGHSQVLSARSNVFAKTLQTDMKERREGRIYIKRASMVDVKQLVDYMYSGKLDTSYVRLKELLILADRFEVLQLVESCSSKLSKTLNKSNAVELGIFGDKYNVKSLVDECARFITNNMMTSNPYQQDWMEQMKGSPDLMLKIIKELNRSGLVLDGSPEDDEEAQAQAHPRIPRRLALRRKAKVMW